jgi:hypothetical protein
MTKRALSVESHSGYDGSGGDFDTGVDGARLFCLADPTVGGVSNVVDRCDTMAELRRRR